MTWITGMLLIFISINSYAGDTPFIVHTSIYQDATKKLTFTQVREIDSKGHFKAVKNIENLGISSDITWIKVVVHNPADEPFKMFLRWKESMTHIVHFYEIGNDTIRESISGLSVNNDEKEITSNAICFPVMLPPNSTRIYFLQISTPYNKEMNITLVNIDQLYKDERTYNIFAGAIICSLFIISLYNLFLGFSLKDRIYFHFVAANLADTFAATTMFCLLPVILPFIPYNTSPFTTTLSVGLFGIFYANFIIHFLKLKQQNKLLYRIFTGTIMLELAAIIQGNISYYFFDGTYFLIPLVHLVFITLVFIGVMASYLKGNTDARFMLLGWLVFWFGLMVKLLTIVGVLPATWFSDYFVYMSGVIESIFLSFALADRYNSLQQEKLQLEINLQTKEKDLGKFAANNKIRYRERKIFLSDLQELAKSEADKLPNKLKSLIFNLVQKLESEGKFIHKADNIHVINAEFEDKLKSSFPQLSQSDIELCGYIKLNMSVKEIADIKRTSQAAIKMARYRLKGKLQLNEQKLDDFIQSTF